MITAQKYQEQMISATNMQRRFSHYIESLKSKEFDSLFVTKSNRVEAVFMSPEHYDYLVGMVERVEELSIALAVEKARSSDTRHDLHGEQVQDLLSEI